MSPRLFTQGHRELMAQHQDLGILPPRLPPRQAQHRHGPGHDEEDQLQAHKPKIIACQPEPDRPPGTVHATKPTASGKASAQVAQVFGTHKFGRMSTVKTPVEIDEEALPIAAEVPGTKTKRHAVGAAVREAGQRLVRMRVLVKLGEMTDRANLDCEEYRWGLRKTGPPRR